MSSYTLSSGPQDKVSLFHFETPAAGLLCLLPRSSSSTYLRHHTFHAGRVHDEQGREVPGLLELDFSGEERVQGSPFDSQSDASVRHNGLGTRWGSRGSSVKCRGWGRFL